MELKIKPYHKNNFPIGGILIKHASVAVWLKEIQNLRFTLNDIQIFVIPNTTPNSIWGCFIITQKTINLHEIGKNEACQKVSESTYIPEKAIIYPPMTGAEIETLFQSAKHIIHPEFGIVELTEELNLKELMTEPLMKSYFVTKPEPPVFIPKQIKQFQIKPIAPEEILSNLEEYIFPRKEKMKDDSLNLLEKGKLAFYKMLFKRNKPKGENGIATTEKTGIWSKIESFLSLLSSKENKWTEKLQQDFEDLEKRNQKQVDKFLELLKNNPEEALKYAIPLDENGSSRGGAKIKLDLTKRWSDFSLFGNSGQSSSGSIDLGDSLQVLRNQYNITAQNLIREKQYHKAAFIYMKLLKDHHMAALTLENGGYYQEAATIYLKHALNKNKAAECYEKGNMTNEAITLYKELNQNEKVGDLYVNLQKRKEADIYFEKVVDEYKSKNQYVKASLIYKNKMHNNQGGQALLLEGWRTSKDALNCLGNYFSNINDIKLLKTEIANVYANDLNNQNSESFLQVIQHEYNKKNELSDSIKEMAYEIIAAQIPTNPSIVSEMKGFNKTDKELIKDALRFKVGNKK